MKISLNNYVFVQLTDYGKSVCRDYYNKYGQKAPSLEGKVKFLLWELMKIFGEKCYQGNTNVFKDCLIEIEN